MRNLKKIFKKMGKNNEPKNEQGGNEEQQENVEVQPENELDQNAEMQAKINELNDKYLRLYSEFDNFRKRTSKEKIDLMKSAGEDFFKGLLPVVDDFERAIKANAEITDINVVKDGVNLIYNKFKN